MTPDRIFDGTFDTARLRLRPITASAPAPDGIEALLTPPVLRHLPPALALPQGGAPAWLEARLAECTVLAVDLAGGGPLVGLLLIVAEAGDRSRCHIGYLLAESAWGQGLASEMLSGLVTALDAGPARHLLAGVAADNPASARVLEKAGFRRSREDGPPDSLGYVRQVGGGAAICGTCPG